MKTQMTFSNETEKLKAQIQELQEKLQKLEEQDPEMLLLRQGKVDFVDYNGKGGNKYMYIRIEYTDSFAGEYNWCVRRVGEDAIRPVSDVNVYAPLEELYQKEVVKQKDDYPYKKYTPEETEQSLKEAFREAVKQGVVSSSNKPQTLYDLIAEWWEYLEDTLDMDSSIKDLVNDIEEWLPKEQSAAGSQNAYVECSVEGFNDAINKIRRKLQ